MRVKLLLCSVLWHRWWAQPWQCLITLQSQQQTLLAAGLAQAMLTAAAGTAAAAVAVAGIGKPAVQQQ
jgi:hypothetical protein